MLLSIVRRLGGSGHRLVMAPTKQKGDFASRAGLGLWQLVGPNKFGFRHLWSLLPSEWRHRYGLIAESELDVVLDAAGYGFTEAWGEDNIVNCAQSFAAHAKRGRVVILLPQAFGPFTSDRTRAAVKLLVESVALVFARDAVSFGHLEECAGGPRANIRFAPDFTNLIAAEVPARPLPGDVFVTLNSRVFDRGIIESREVYLSFMERMITELRKTGCRPFILIHEHGVDVEVSRTFAKKVSVPVLDVDDPVEAKAIIAACRFGFSSRFHAVVGALSQGVPVLVVGWAHKYDELMREYGFTRGLLKMDTPWSEVADLVSELANPETSMPVRAKINSSSIAQKQAAEAMWKEVENLLGQVAL